MSSAGNGMNLRGNNRMRHHSAIPPSAAVANTQQQQIFCGSLWQQWPSGDSDPVVSILTTVFEPASFPRRTAFCAELLVGSKWREMHM